MSIVAIPNSIESVGPDILEVIGVLTDNISFKREFQIKLAGSLTVNGVKSQLLGLLNSTQSQDEIRKILKVGVPFDLTVIPPIIDPPKPPTQDELDLASYNRALSLLGEAHSLVINGADSQLEIDAVALVQKRRIPIDKQFQARFDAEVNS